MTQHDMIKQHMADFGSITPMEAFTDLGITKLATRIGELDRQGTRIDRHMETGKNRYGKTTRYMRYRLAE